MTLNTISLIIVASTFLQIQPATVPSTIAADEHGRFVDALVNTPSIGPIYADDGAGDGTIMVADQQQGERQHPFPAVKAIVDLGDKALPLLIDCLGDTRITSATMIFQAGNPHAKPVPVPVGEVCLDVLLNVVVPTKEVFVDSCPPEEKEGDEPCCFTDGLGACVNKGFYFRPDAYDLRDGRAVAHSIVTTVQSNWRKAYKNGLLTYRYPVMWKRN